MDSELVLKSVDKVDLPDIHVGSDLNTGSFLRYVRLDDFVDFIHDFGKAAVGVYDLDFLIKKNRSKDSKAMAIAPGLNRDMKFGNKPVVLYSNGFSEKSDKSRVKDISDIHGFRCKGIGLSDFFQYIKSCFHEGRHIEQYKHIFTPSDDESLDFVALAVISETGCPSHYFLRNIDGHEVNYYNSPTEVDAQIMGLSRAFSYCNNKLPDKDWFNFLRDQTINDFRFLYSYKNDGLDISDSEILKHVNNSFKDAMVAAYLRYDDSYLGMLDQNFRCLREDLLYEVGCPSIFRKVKSLFGVKSYSSESFIRDMVDRYPGVLDGDRFRSEVFLKYTNSAGLKCENIKRAFDKVDSVHDKLFEVANVSRFRDEDIYYFSCGASEYYSDLVSDLGIDYDVFKPIGNGVEDVLQEAINIEKFSDSEQTNVNEIDDDEIR